MWGAQHYDDTEDLIPLDSSLMYFILMKYSKWKKSFIKQKSKWMKTKEKHQWYDLKWPDLFCFSQYYCVTVTKIWLASMCSRSLLSTTKGELLSVLIENYPWKTDCINIKICWMLRGYIKQEMQGQCKVLSIIRRGACLPNYFEFRLCVLCLVLKAIRAPNGHVSRASPCHTILKIL